MPAVDPWHVKRDARRYVGSNPVVAHPPCQLWGAFAPINYKRWGGEHNRPGNDGGCFAHALQSVRRCGGVLEHPAGSKAWAAHGLIAPTWRGWRCVADQEWVCEVWQSAYGHKAQKRTWLFYRGARPPGIGRWWRVPGTHQCGHDSKAIRQKPKLRRKAASATPPAFARWLVRLARGTCK